MRARSPILIAGLALAIGGCGGGAGAGGDFEGEERQVAEAVEALQAAASRQETADEVCRDSLSRALVARLSTGGTECESEIRHAVADADLYDLQVSDVTVRGTAAEARVQTAAGDQTTSATLQLVQEQGDWRVDGIRRAAN